MERVRADDPVGEQRRDVRGHHEHRPLLPEAPDLYVNSAVDPDTSATLMIDKQVDAAVIGSNQRDRVRSDRGDANYKAVPSQFWRQVRMPPTTPATSGR